VKQLADDAVTGTNVKLAFVLFFLLKGCLSNVDVHGLRAWVACMGCVHGFCGAVSLEGKKKGKAVFYCLKRFCVFFFFFFFFFFLFFCFFFRLGVE